MPFLIFQPKEKNVELPPTSFFLFQFFSIFKDKENITIQLVPSVQTQALSVRQSCNCEKLFAAIQNRNARRDRVKELSGSQARDNSYDYHVGLRKDFNIKARSTTWVDEAHDLHTCSTHPSTVFSLFTQ